MGNLQIEAERRKIKSKAPGSRLYLLKWKVFQITRQIFFIIFQAIFLFFHS